MHTELFNELVMILRSYSHSNSRSVFLEEQVAIFLYTCVTGVPSVHVGEWFHTKITKAFFHKIAFSCMTSISTSHTYALTGWEGSISDAWIFGDACLHNLDIPNSKYPLGDLRFSSKPSILVPYQGVCYHLAEWGHANVQWVISPFSLPMLMKYRPVNHQELFNLWHASAWNVIECAFGVLKKCSQILLLPLPYLLNI